MKTFKEFVAEAKAANVLWEVMGWDEKHGPTSAEMNAYSILMGWCPRSSSDKVIPVYADLVTDEQMFALFVKHGTKTMRSELVEYHWNDWYAEQWHQDNHIYFYNPVCKSCAADAYECLMQI